jgi:hypothetical protein
MLVGTARLIATVVAEVFFAATAELARARCPAAAQFPIDFAVVPTVPAVFVTAPEAVSIEALRSAAPEVPRALVRSAVPVAIPRLLFLLPAASIATALGSRMPLVAFLTHLSFLPNHGGNATPHPKRRPPARGIPRQLATSNRCYPDDVAIPTKSPAERRSHLAVPRTANAAGPPRRKSVRRIPL